MATNSKPSWKIARRRCQACLICFAAGFAAAIVAIGQRPPPIPLFVQIA
jgi:hypothetical protein